MGDIGPIACSKAQESKEVREVIKDWYLQGLRRGASQGMAVKYEDTRGEETIVCVVRSAYEWKRFADKMEKEIRKIPGFEHYIVALSEVDFILY